jgi:hypothetical protein
MPDIVAFLRERLADDEAYARNAFRPHGDEGPKNGPDWREIWSGTVECGPGGEHIATFDSQLSRHIARHDPARVLREVTAKRALVESITAETHLVVDSDPYFTCNAATEERDGGESWAREKWGTDCGCGRDDRVKTRLKILAAVYSDHPDYREEWTP